MTNIIKIVSFAVLGVCAVAMPAAAQSRKVSVAVVPLGPGLDAEAASAAWALETSLGNSLVSLRAVALGDADAQRTQNAAQAAKLIKQAYEALDGMEYAAAVGHATKAIELWEQADLTKGLSGLLEAKAVKTIALFSSGRKAEARNETLGVLTLNPDYRFDPQRMTPAASTLVEDARQKQRARAAATLELRSTPPGALAFIDGVFKGVTPLQAELVPGAHYVTLSAAGYMPVQRKSFVGGGQPLSYTLEPAGGGKELLAMLDELKLRLPAGPPKDLAVRLTKWAGVDEVIVAGVASRSGKLVAKASRMGKGGQLLATVDQPLKGRGIFAKNEWTEIGRKLLSQELPRQPDTLEPVVASSSTTRTTSKPASKVEVARSADAQAQGKVEPESGGGGSTMGWVLLGGGAAAMAGGVFAGLTAKDVAAQARATPQTKTEDYNRLVSKGKTLGYVADGLFVASALAAGAGVVLLLSGGSDDAKPSETSAAIAPVPGGFALVLQGGL